jgi:hypothetical protein
MNDIPQQGELFALICRPTQHPFRLRANDVIRIDGKLCRVIRVTECAAVVLVNRPPRVFSTRFDKPVRFQPSPVTFRISANAEVEIVSRPRRKSKNHKPR